MTNSKSLNPGEIRVAALYRFAAIKDVEAVQARLHSVCEAGAVKGTLLVATEGLNGTIAGPEAGIETVLADIRARASPIWRSNTPGPATCRFCG